MTDDPVRVLDLDRELAEGLSAADAASASRSLSATVRRLEPGPWQSDAHDGHGVPPGGLLVIEGCVSREVSVLGVPAAVDFLAHGDLLHVADERPLFSVPSSASWPVLEPTRVAVLDAAFVQALGAWPRVMSNLLRRRSGTLTGSRTSWRSATSHASSCACTCCSGCSPTDGDAGAATA